MTPAVAVTGRKSGGAGGRPRRRNRGARRRRPPGRSGAWGVAGWVAVAAGVAVGLWAVQLAVLAWRLEPFDWSEYWFWRRLYRPGLKLAAAVASSVVDGGLGRRPLRPLDPAGARHGFLLAAAAYALLATATLAAAAAVVRRRRSA